MSKFEFRLARVLEYRRYEEDWARTALIAARNARAEIEVQISHVAERRRFLLQQHVATFESHCALENSLIHIDAAESDLMAQLSAAQIDEENAVKAWQRKQRETNALEKLYDGAYISWTKTEARIDQALMDDLAVMRRTA